MSEPIYPFYCGTQKLDWHLNNCKRCAKGYNHEAPVKYGCDLERALDMAFGDDGSVEPAIASRLGMTGEYLWKCPEWVPKHMAHPDEGVV